MLSWLAAHQVLLWWLGAASLLLLLASLVLLPLLIARLPSDYFHTSRDHDIGVGRGRPLLRALWLLARNLLGLILIVVGLVMLVLPGQGVLTILAGLSLCVFPGKRELERRLVGQPAVLRAINWLRARAGRPRLRL